MTSESLESKMSHPLQNLAPAAYYVTLRELFYSHSSSNIHYTLIWCIYSLPCKHLRQATASLRHTRFPTKLRQTFLLWKSLPDHQEFLISLHIYLTHMRWHHMSLFTTEYILTVLLRLPLRQHQPDLHKQHETCTRVRNSLQYSFSHDISRPSQLASLRQIRPLFTHRCHQS